MNKFIIGIKFSDFDKISDDKSLQEGIEVSLEHKTENI